MTSTVKGIFQTYVEGATGLPLSGATITVYNELNGSAATIYSDRAGTSKTNPFTSDSNGFVQFYADAGRYKIVATSGAFTSELRNVPIGDSKETDRVVNVAAAPTINDDSNSGYLIGQIWRDISASPTDYYICEDNTVGAAEWRQMEVWLNNRVASGKVVKTISATSYTVLNSDLGKVLYFTAGSSVALTVPAGLTVDDGTSIDFHFEVAQGGAGVVDWSGSPSATVNGDTATTTQYQIAIFRSVANDSFIARVI